MQIYFVRHGRTQYNLEHRFQGGGSDSPLLADGIAGAKAAGRYLADVRFTRVYSSPQQRALDTAKYVVAENHWQPDVQLEAGLAEFNFGTWDGQRESEVEPQAYAQVLLHEPGNYDPQRAGGGEDYAGFVKRTTSAVKRLVEQNNPASDQAILVVSHGLVTTMTVKTLLGVPVAELRNPIDYQGQRLKTIGNGIVANDSLTVVETLDNQHFTLKKWNDTSFLTD